MRFYIRRTKLGINDCLLIGFQRGLHIEMLIQPFSIYVLSLPWQRIN